MKIEPNVVEKLLPKNDFVLYMNEETMSFMKGDVEKLIAANRMTGPFDYKGYVYPDLLRKLDPSLVNYKLPE